MKRFLRILLAIIAIPIFSVALLLIYATLTNYQPAPIEVISQNESAAPLNDSTFSLLIWNIGYSGLGDDMDFFYDGGKQVRTTEDRLKQNLASVQKFLKNNDSIDFILLQEVDLESRRSYYTNQHDSILSVLNNFAGHYALNYKVGFIPQPLSNPYGKVLAGLASYSKHIPNKTERYSFIGNYNWPMSVFMLDRCFMAQHFPLTSGKELVVINTHNSAYDDGNLKAKQNEQMKSFLKEQEKKGNFAVVGGDWNQLPPNYSPNFSNTAEVTWGAIQIDADFLTGWEFAFDNNVPTNRELNKPFSKEPTNRKVIDFFLVSPNIEVVSVKGINLNFVHSDHNPVIITIKLK